jgi:predicted transcriptional regulator
MVLKGVKQVDIARSLGVTPGTVSAIVSGKRASLRIRREIARLLHIEMKDLWKAA